MADEKVIRIVSKVEDSRTGDQPSVTSRSGGELVTTRNKDNQIQNDILSLINLIKNSSGVIQNPMLLRSMWTESQITPMLPSPGSNPSEAPGPSLTSPSPGNGIIPLSPGRDLITSPSGPGANLGGSGGGGGIIVPPPNVLNANVPPGGGGGNTPAGLLGGAGGGGNLVPPGGGGNVPPGGPMFGPGQMAQMLPQVGMFLLNLVGMNLAIVSAANILHEIFEGLKSHWEEVSGSMALTQAMLDISYLNKTLETEPQVASANSLVAETREGVGLEWIELKAHMTEIIAPILAPLNVALGGILVFLDMIASVMAVFARVLIWVEKACIKALWWFGLADDPFFEDADKGTGYLHNEIEEVLAGVRGRDPYLQRERPNARNKSRRVTF